MNQINKPINLYYNFILNKQQLSGNFGFHPVYLPDRMFDFQKYITSWALNKGRAGIFADTLDLEKL